MFFFLFSFFLYRQPKAGGGNLLRRIFWKCLSQTILYQIGWFGTRIQTAMYGMHSTETEGKKASARRGLKNGRKAKKQKQQNSKTTNKQKKIKIRMLQKEN